MQAPDDDAVIFGVLLLIVLAALCACGVVLYLEVFAVLEQA